MSPPDLAGNTPIADIIHPTSIGFGETFRHKLRASIFHTINSSLNKWCHLHKPLFGNQWFHNSTAALTVAYCMIMILDFHQETLLIQFTHQILAAFIAFLSCIFTGFCCHMAVHADYYDAFQVMAHAHFKVVRVMSRRNFNRTGSKFEVYVRISNDRNNPVS